MITLYTVLVIFAVIMQAFFALSEIVFTTADRTSVKKASNDGNKRAKLTYAFLEKSENYLGATLVGTNLAVVVYSVLATRIFMEYFEGALAPMLATLSLVPVTLLFAEITPKIIGSQFATPLSYRLAGIVFRFFHFFRPLIIVVNFIAKIILFPFRKLTSNRWPRTFTKSDLKRILLLGHETGEVEADEVELIHKVLDLEAKKVRSIMVPLFRVSSIEEGETVKNFKDIVGLTNFSRIPVYKGKKDNLTGIANIYDILFGNDVSDVQAIEEFSRKPVYVDADDGLDIALARLRHKKRPMGIVITGEEKKIIGIITIEDILEEIVGEI